MAKKLICKDCKREIPKKYFQEGFCLRCIDAAVNGDWGCVEDIADRSFEKVERLYKMED